MSWEQWVEGFKIFWSQPIPIIGFTVGTVVISLIFIIAKTSVGKKAINKANAKVEELKLGYNKLKDDTELKIKELKDAYEEKLALINAAKEKEQDIIIAIGENIHNKDVKFIIDNYKNELKNKRIVISDIVENKVNEIKNQYNDIVTLYKNEFESLKKQYEDEIAKLEDLTNEK